MQMNVAGIRRNIKNLAHNYSDAQIKVREATSNDPWGPSATIMAEIADLTYNVVAYTEIMQMIWKRLNDHGKNWRHVYKALILLEYLIKTGTEKVAQQCKENIFAIQTLKEFIHLEEGKDQGLHVREKAKQLVSLLRDEERLKNERTKALKAKERFAQHASGFGSDGYIEGPTNRETPTGWPESEPKNAAEIEFVRPQTAGEEELQLQLAMAMSREEAEQEEAKRRSDDVRLQLALSQSEQDFNNPDRRHGDRRLDERSKQSHLMDLLDISLGATSLASPTGGAAATGDPWGTPVHGSHSQQSDPWSRTSSPPVDPWQTPTRPPISIGAAALPTSAGDAWLPQRTQSPSVASGSSNEGWLQNNSTPTSGLNGNLSNSSAPDPWLSKTAGAARSTPPVDPWLGGQSHQQQPQQQQNHHQQSDNSGGGGGGIDDPWRPKAPNADPWAPPNNLESRPSPVGAITSPMSDLDEFDVITNRNKTGQINNSTNGSNNNNSSLLDEMDPLSTKKHTKTPQSFLGENSSLVNLDNLIKPVASNNMSSAAYNPFSDATIAPAFNPPKPNLFQQQAQIVPSINQLKQQPFPVTLNQDPWAPVNSNASNTTAQLDEYLIDCDSDQITISTNKNLYDKLNRNNNYNTNFNGNQNNTSTSLINNRNYSLNNNGIGMTAATNLYNNMNYKNTANLQSQILRTTHLTTIDCNNQNEIQNHKYLFPNSNNGNLFGNDVTFYSFENINYPKNNNTTWMKPEAAASNPFLS